MKKVAGMYGLELLEDMHDAYAEKDIPPELKIKTHYESLDIAGSKKIHYLRFRLPEILPDLDKELQGRLEEENAANNE